MSEAAAYAPLPSISPLSAVGNRRVSAYTAGASHAERTEDRKGTIEAGKVADLAVLSQDIFTVAPDQLPATTAWMTIVGGEVLHATPPAP